MNLKRNRSEDSSDQQKPQKKKVKGVEVGKFEVSDNTIRFFAAKGLGKKRWVAVREIPIPEIEHIENLDNELSVTWKGVTDSFFTKEKTDSFGKLVEQINGMLENQRKAVETNEKVETIDKNETNEKNDKNALRRSELLMVINASIGIIDLSFDVLNGLQDKRINWQRLEGYSTGFGENTNFTGQTLPPLTWDFSKIASAVKTQVPNETSKEAFNILKAIHEYFNSLNPDEDIKENSPSFQTTKTLISAYFLLNDLLLGKFVGDKETSRETSELETALQNLAEANFKVDVEELKRGIDAISLEYDKQTLVEDNRAIFKEQLKSL